MRTVEDAGTKATVAPTGARHVDRDIISLHDHEQSRSTLHLTRLSPYNHHHHHSTGNNDNGNGQSAADSNNNNHHHRDLEHLATRNEHWNKCKSHCDGSNARIWWWWFF